MYSTRHVNTPPNTTEYVLNTSEYNVLASYVIFARISVTKLTTASPNGAHMPSTSSWLLFDISLASKIIAVALTSPSSAIAWAQKVM